MSSGDNGRPDNDNEATGGTEAPSARDFIREIIAEDIRSGKHGGRVHTRFPPEPNGYLHIGHAKSICLNFGVAAEHGGKCNLRFDDTNPATEEAEYVDSIKNDIRWLGFDWDDREYYASDYFDQLYEYAEKLIQKGKAYVCDLSEEEIREYRGTVTSPGKNSPGRGRTSDENLDLFRRMRAGEFPDGSKVLRAKIDMASPNMKMRDPLLYRIRRAHHYRTGDKWCIYPFYDWAHGQSDSIEGITHSLCTLEFENNRELYEWFIRELEIFPSRQIEFARLNVSHTVMSKRRLLRLVKEGYVAGWDDPRMPTLSGMRRRGFPPEAIRAFAERVGVAKRDNMVDISLLEYYIREHLNRSAPRVMAVLRPLRVVVENYPEGQVEEVEAINNPEDPGAGSRTVPFSRVIYIEADDFREDPPRKFFRLSPGKEVRLKHAYYITCTDVVKDDAGNVVELRCTYDPESRGGGTPDGRKVKGTLHWVSEQHAVDAEVRLYESLLAVKDPSEHEGGDFTAMLNADSLETLKGCKVEPSLAGRDAGASFQFLRHGYFVVDPDSSASAMVFNRTVSLRDSWARIEKSS